MPVAALLHVYVLEHQMGCICKSCDGMSRIVHIGSCIERWCFRACELDFR